MSTEIAPGGGKSADVRAISNPEAPSREQLERVVRAEPGLTLKQAIDKITHHYSSDRAAASSLVHWIVGGKIAGVSVRRSHVTHGRLELFPTEDAR